MSLFFDGAATATAWINFYGWTDRHRL